MSYRAPGDQLAQIDAFAAQQGITRHAAIRSLIYAGLLVEAGRGPDSAAKVADVLHAGPPRPAAKVVLAQAEAAAAHLGKPKPKRSRARWVFKTVQLGPTVPPAGSRLKDRKAKR